MHLLDLKASLRSLLRAPAFTVPALLTLALGVGSCVAIWSAIHRVFLASLPYGAPGHLYALKEVERGEVVPVSGATFMAWRDRAPGVQAAAIHQSGRAVLALPGGPLEVRTQAVSGEFFQVLGVRPQAGRLLGRSDEARLEGDLVVLSDALWREAFHGDPNIAGRVVSIGGGTCTVTGVLPRGFFWPHGTEHTEAFILFRPERFMPSGGHGNHSWSAFLRLREGSDPAQVARTLGALVDGIKVAGGKEAGWSAKLVSLREDTLFRGTGSRTLFYLLASAGILLFIALLNAAGLLLARGLARVRTAALQRALGASRADLFGRHLADGLLLGVGACLLGSLFAQSSLATLGRWLRASSPSPLLEGAWGLDHSALLVALGLALGAAVLLALFPLAQMRERQLQRALNEGGPGGGSRFGLRLRRWLVVAQVAMSTALLATCGFFLRSYLLLRGQPTGFQAQGRIVFSVRDSRKEASFERTQQLWQELRQRFSGLPGVTRVGAGRAVPFAGFNMGVLSGSADQGPLSGDHGFPTGIVPGILPGYFESLAVPLRAGRFPSESDRVGGGFTCWVNEAYARRAWPGEPPVGRGLRVTTWSDQAPKNTVFQVAGIVADTRTASFDEPAGPMVYLAEAQFGSLVQSFILETQTSPVALRTAIQTILKEQLPDNPPAQVRRLEDLLDASVQDRQSSLAILSALAVAAVLLAAVGLASLQAYQVVQRRREIAIRMALGARALHILRRFTGQGMGLACIGIFAGLAGSALLHRLLSSQLFALASLPIQEWALTSLVLGGVSLLASLVPALRALRLHPAFALRDG